VERILCKDYEHIDLNIEKCPRCGSLAWEIHESLYVTDYCEGTHERDLFSCFKCDASISIDLLMRLNEAEYRLEEYRINFEPFGKTEGV